MDQFLSDPVLSDLTNLETGKVLIAGRGIQGVAEILKIDAKIVHATAGFQHTIFVSGLEPSNDNTYRQRKSIWYGRK